MAVQSYINAFDAVILEEAEVQTQLEAIGVPSARLDLQGTAWIADLLAPDEE